MSRADRAPAGTGAVSMIIRPRHVLRGLVLVTLGLASISLALLTSSIALGDFPMRDTLVRLFDVDGENNVPTYFNAGLAGVTTLLMWRIAAVDTGRKRHWSGLALLGAVVATDEILAVHEAFITPLRTLLHTGGLFYFAWTIPALVLLAVLGAVYLPFVLRIPSGARFLLLGGAAVCLLGAIGVEALGGNYFEQFGRDNLGYVLLTAVEESLEMIGLSIVIYALLKYLSAWETGIDIRVSISDPSHT